jgi:hypothetical protein
MKPIPATVLILTLGTAACAHGPKPYSFTGDHAANDIDVVVRTLEANGLKPAQIDRRSETITTQWFDTGYRFRGSDDFHNFDYYTDVFLRYRVRIQRVAGTDRVVLDTDVQRCSPIDSYVTDSGVNGSCQPMKILFPSQQQLADELGEKLRLALPGSTWASAKM